MRSGAPSGSDGSTSVEAGRWVGSSVFGEVTARPTPQDRRRVRRLATFGTRALDLARAAGASFKPTTQARDTDGMVWNTGFGLNAQPPTDASHAALIVTCHPVL